MEKNAVLEEMDMGYSLLVEMVIWFAFYCKANTGERSFCLPSLETCTEEFEYFIREDHIHNIGYRFDNINVDSCFSFYG